MDKIGVSVEALSTAEAILKDLGDNISAFVTKSSSAIKEQFNGIDADLRATIEDYLEILSSLSRHVVELEDVNRNAIRDRVNRISEYSATIYKKRNI